MNLRTLLLLFGFVLSGASASSAANLHLILRDQESGEPAAARLQIFSQEGSALSVPDSTLHTHLDLRSQAYLYAEGELDLELAPGGYRVCVLGGPARIPRQYTVDLAGDRELALTVGHWIDLREWGWISADPHVHRTHDDGTGVYPLPSVEEVGRMARAEDLDLLYLLDNRLDTPSGAIRFDQSGSLIVWGEEFRSGFWGHVVVLGARTLVTVDGNPWANGPGLPAWPLLQKVLANTSPPLAYIAHPHTGGSSSYALNWPQTGEARELASLAMGSQVAGVATASWSNDSPRPWNLEPLIDGLEAGAHWASLGETDAVLDRSLTPAVGSLRSFAYVGNPAQPAHALLDRQWRDAVLAQRCYASNGPLLLNCRLDGAMLGDHLQLSVDSAALQLHLVSWTPIERVTIHGRGGRCQDLPFNPSDANDLSVTTTLEFPRDDAIFVEVVAQGGTWFAPQDSLRLVSSPIYVERGIAAEVPVDIARRNADELAYRYSKSLKERGYPSAADSAAAREILLGDAAKWEALADDPPGAFRLLWPEEGRVLGETGFRISWQHARNYDGEHIRYVVEVDRSPNFDTPQVYPALEDTVLDLRSLERGQTYWWRVRAEEADGDFTWNEDGARNFQIALLPVAAPA
ncbi:MAG TPA: CehA/McbA family metallohydrolase, partial [Candidatus Krumholzibacteria bacterium]|nr:CehA/McbA family metallohydrolase [Candidatus Krumholzibacteria bacterium]